MADISKTLDIIIAIIDNEPIVLYDKDSKDIKKIADDINTEILIDSKAIIKNVDRQKYFDCKDNAMMLKELIS